MNIIKKDNIEYFLVNDNEALKISGKSTIIKALKNRSYKFILKNKGNISIEKNYLGKNNVVAFVGSVTISKSQILFSFPKGIDTNRINTDCLEHDMSSFISAIKNFEEENTNGIEKTKKDCVIQCH